LSIIIELGQNENFDEPITENPEKIYFVSIQCSNASLVAIVSLDIYLLGPQNLAHTE
jgi:hypothetical protein